MRKSFNFSVNFGTAFVCVGYGQRSQRGVQFAPGTSAPRVPPTPHWSAETRFISVAHYTKSFVQRSGYKALSMLVINRAKR